MEVPGYTEEWFSSPKRGFEYLRAEVKPIEVRAATFSSVRDRESDFPFNINDLSSTAEEIEFDPRTDFIISEINSNNKFTRGLANCTSVVAVGMDKAEGVNISFVTHQSDPPIDSAHPFYADLQKGLLTMKDRCVDKTIDIAIAGGSFAHPVRQKAYRNTILALHHVVASSLGFEPTVAMGPKIDVTNDEIVYCDTQARVVYVMRSQFNGQSVIQGFKSSELDQLLPQWVRQRESYAASGSNWDDADRGVL